MGAAFIDGAVMDRPSSGIAVKGNAPNGEACGSGLAGTGLAGAGFAAGAASSLGAEDVMSKTFPMRTALAKEPQLDLSVRI